MIGRLYLTLLFCCVSIFSSSVAAQTWSELLPSIRQRFPRVQQVSTAELAMWLSTTNRPAPLLVDVRSVEEFAVSHLPGAQRAESIRQVKALLGTNRQPVVLYCSVGYRSSQLAAKLINNGITNVFNLEGSIFAWANEGRTVMRDRQEVKDVHPYDEKWGQLLAAPLRTMLPR